MRLLRHLADLAVVELCNGSVVTIGAYDGLHLGHEQLLERVKAASRRAGSTIGRDELRADAKRVFLGAQAAGAIDAVSREIRGACRVTASTSFIARDSMQQMRDIRRPTRLSGES